MLEKVEGTIIKTVDYGETHKIVTIFSRRFGKFAAIARGAKKPKSRMAAVTQPFVQGEFLLYLNKGLSAIQQADVVNAMRIIREDIVKTAYAAYVAELTDKLMDEKIPDGYIYDQFLKTLDWISEHDGADIPMMMYELKLFNKGGFAPTVDKCANCGCVRGSFHFSVQEGGLLCQQCAQLDTYAIPLQATLVRLLHLFSTVGLEQIGRISVKEENCRLLWQLITAYYDQYGGYALKSRKFIKQLDQFKKKLD